MFEPRAAMTGDTDGVGGAGGSSGPGAAERRERPGEIETAPPTATTTLLYSAVHSDASVLACRAPALGDWLLRAPAAEQLAYLHSMHVEIDGLLRRIRATKVSMSGEKTPFPFFPPTST